MDISEADDAYIKECEALFNEAENHFTEKEYLKMDRLVKKDYSNVNSRINSNLVAPK